MVEVQAVVTVKVTPIRLCKVVSAGGHQIVVGGRLVSMTRDGKTTPLPDLPEYKAADFPCSVDSYVEDENGSSGVTVLVQDRAGVMKPVGPVRACALLFSARGADAVRQWIRQEASK